MINKSPAFQFYPGDFLSDENVISMTFEERGVYITLLCNCWIQGSIPGDHAKILKLLPGFPGASLPKIVMDRFKTDPENLGRLVNNRLEKEREKQEDYHKKKSDSGKKGAQKRWEKEQNNNSAAIVSPLANDSSSSPSSSPSSSSHHKPSEISEKSKSKNKELETLWSKCLEMIKSQILPESYDQWFSETFPSYLQGGILFIGVPNQFVRKALIENYREPVELFLQEISGNKIMVDFRIEKNQPNL